MFDKRIFPLMALLISMAIPVFAQTPAAPAGVAVKEKGSEAYRTYEVKRGDTLWGISKRFIEDPYYWPDLWANNPDIQNPHFITPGQKLRIYSGPITVVGVEEGNALAATAEVTPATEVAQGAAPANVVESAPIVTPEPLVMISAPAGVSFISEAVENSKGTILDFTNDRYLAASGDTVFVRIPAGTTVSVGDNLQILKSQGKIIHPVSKKRLGYQVDQLGTLEIVALGKDLETAIVRKNSREIERGAWLTPYRPVQEKISLRRAEKELTGMVVGASSHKELQGPSEVLFIDLGENDGLKVGNLLTLTRSRKGTDLALPQAASLSYPEELVGYALVIETNPSTATAVILKSLSPSVIGDLVRTQTGSQVR